MRFHLTAVERSKHEQSIRRKRKERLFAIVENFVRSKRCRLALKCKNAVVLVGFSILI